MTKFSIIVPVYQAQSSLDRCIKSLLRQTLSDIEIILVDDGSTDQSPSICDHYEAEDPRIQVIHKPNEGVSAARNDGLLAARGEWVIFCDSDDWMEPYACELLCQTGTEKHVDVVLGDIHLIQKERKIYNQFFAEEFVWRSRRRLDDLVAADIYQAYCPLPPSTPSIGYGGPWNKAVRRQFLLDHEIRFDTKLGGIFDDILYTAFLYANASGVAYVQRPVYNYVLNPSSVTRSYRPDTLAVNHRIFQAFSSFIHSHAPNKRWEQAYQAMVIRRLEESLRLYFFHPSNEMPRSTRLALLRKTIRTKPYFKALRTVEKRKLTSSQRKMVSLLCLHWMGGLWILYQLKVILKKI